MVGLPSIIGIAGLAALSSDVLVSGVVYMVGHKVTKSKPLAISIEADNKMITAIKGGRP